MKKKLFRSWKKNRGRTWDSAWFFRSAIILNPTRKCRFRHIGSQYPNVVIYFREVFTNRHLFITFWLEAMGQVSLESEYSRELIFKKKVWLRSDSISHYSFKIKFLVFRLNFMFKEKVLHFEAKLIPQPYQCCTSKTIIWKFNKISFFSFLYKFYQIIILFSRMLWFQRYLPYCPIAKTDQRATIWKAPS